MLPILRIFGLLGCLLILAPATSRGQESAPSADADKHDAPPLNPAQSYLEPLGAKRDQVSFRFRSDFYSRYLWNGIPYSNGAVWQPSGTMEIRGIGLNVWGNFVLNDEPNQGQINEIDLTLYYRHSIKGWDLQGSLIGAMFVNDEPSSLNRGPPSFQGYFQVDHPVGPIGIFSSLNVGFLQPGGTLFWTLGVSYQRDLPLHFSLETSLQFGLGDARFNRGLIADIGTQANLLEYSLAFPWTPLRHTSFTPHLTVSGIPAPAVRQVLGHSVFVWGGLSVAYDFQ